MQVRRRSDACRRGARMVVHESSIFVSNSLKMQEIDIERRIIRPVKMDLPEGACILSMFFMRPLPPPPPPPPR